jgi:hypothetical protein
MLCANHIDGIGKFRAVYEANNRSISRTSRDDVAAGLNL